VRVHLTVPLHTSPCLPCPPACPAPPAEFMYRALDDDDLAVRKNGVMVLTHLILNDMMKAGWGGAGGCRWCLAWARLGAGAGLARAVLGSRLLPQAAAACVRRVLL